jgi:hypothetical protein
MRGVRIHSKELVNSCCDKNSKLKVSVSLQDPPAEVWGGCGLGIISKRRKEGSPRDSLSLRRPGLPPSAPCCGHHILRGILQFTSSPSLLVWQ